MIELIVLDVDGCMSDGSIYYDSLGNEFKRFNVKDGLAISSWIRLGKKVAIITGRGSKIVEKRAKELGIKHLYQNIKDKGVILQKIMQEEGLKSQNIASIGDDLNDLKMFKLSELRFTPQDGSSMLDDFIDVRLKSNGGKGAIREMIEYIINRQNLNKEFIALWQ
jgi:3-deoxy-D-manno-octulosonate 8-phosphate phosphatase (KDO 8-P phosphatase)